MEAKQKIQVPMLQKSVITDLSEEFSIPDYQPEIKRILRVEAIAMPADRYVGPSNAEFSGKLEYTIFYLGEDGEIYGSTFEGDYRVLQPVEIPMDASFADGILCDADIFTESVAGRLLSPRKFQIKTRLHSEIRLYGERLLDEEMPTDLSCERLTGEAICGRILVGESEPIRLSDEIQTGSGDAPTRVVLCRGKVLVNDAAPSDGSVFCRGEVLLKLLIVKEGSDDAPEAILRKLPFEAEIPVDGLRPDAMVAVKGFVTESNVTVEETRILVDTEIRLFARALQTDTLTYTRDLYAPGQESSASFEKVTCQTAISCSGGNFTLSAKVPLAEAGLRAEQRLEDFALIPSIEEVSNEGGRLILSGKCRAQAVASSEGEWTTTEFDVPFRYDAGKCPDEAISDLLASAEVLSCHAKKERDSLSLDGELAVLYTVSGKNEFERAAALSLGEPVACPASTMRVCYPTPGDSLWSLGKRYATPLATLLDANNLSAAATPDSPESIEGAKFLVV